jgi:hypothetical protein
MRLFIIILLFATNFHLNFSLDDKSIISKSKASWFLKRKAEETVNSLQIEWNHEVQFSSCLTSLNQWRKMKKKMADQGLTDCVEACVKEDKREDWRDNNYEELREDYLDNEREKCPRFPCSNCLASLPLKSKKMVWFKWQQRCVQKEGITSENC